MLACISIVAHIADMAPDLCSSNNAYIQMTKNKEINHVLNGFKFLS